MLKKCFAILSIAGVIIGSVATASNADYGVYGSGLQYKSNGSYYYYQAWAQIRSLNESNKVDVWVIKNNDEAGTKTTTVTNSVVTCYSHQVLGPGVTGYDFWVRAA